MPKERRPLRFAPLRLPERGIERRPLRFAPPRLPERGIDSGNQEQEPHVKRDTSPPALLAAQCSPPLGIGTTPKAHPEPPKSTGRFEPPQPTHGFRAPLRPTAELSLRPPLSLSGIRSDLLDVTNTNTQGTLRLRREASPARSRSPQPPESPQTTRQGSIRSYDPRTGYGFILEDGDRHQEHVLFQGMDVCDGHGRTWGGFQRSDVLGARVAYTLIPSRRKGKRAQSVLLLGRVLSIGRPIGAK